jgi:uncharacterized lipoprotein YddW (UPF0748 family)
MNIKTFILTFALLIGVSTSTHAQHPKREFRGAWIQCVNGQYLGKSPKELREMLSSQLDVLQGAKINAIIFQVRAEGDALYHSKMEPWSRYLTGRQGKAPEDGWDPLEWMIDECHKRDMELHAWINPYRAKTKGTTELATNHAAIKYPERIFQYGDLYIFNPALKENIEYTCAVVEDIVERYDVDGIHIDDYFYPYPEGGREIPDENFYIKDKRGFDNIGDWRRDNVNKLIEALYSTIHSTKPWVKFGVSPFGIYRNDKNGSNTKFGSATNGLQNYDDLYADIILWQDKGWIDYLVPQIYWNIGTKAADYDILCQWWNDYCSKRPLYVGQDVERTVKGADPANPDRHQMQRKYAIQRSLPNIQGSCQWYAASVVNNLGNYRTLLEKEFHVYPVLNPEMKFIDKKAPKKPRKARIEVQSNRITLVWDAPKAKKEMDKAKQFVIYLFEPNEKIDLNNPTKIQAVSHKQNFELKGNLMGHTIVITALDRLHNESKGLKIKL